MLNHLSIRNYAIIDEVKLDFNQGFTVVTGETGAGKSILLGALRLVLGGRADLKNLKNSNKKCVVEAHFNIQHLNLINFFKENDIDYDDETIIRREILPSGKSRAFINDVPSTLAKIQKLSSDLIDIHSQFQTSTLLEDRFQFNLVDSVAENAELLNEFNVQLGKFNDVDKRINKIEDELANLQKEKDFNTFLLNELEEANIENVSIQSLEEELHTLENSEGIIDGLSSAHLLFNDEPYGIINQLNEIKQVLKVAKLNFSDGKPVFDRIDSASIELEDISNELYNLQHSLSVDPERLLEVQERLNSLNLLITKHRVQTIEELREIKANLQQSLDNETTKSDELQALKDKKNALQISLDKLATKISNSRKKVIPKVQNIILNTLKEVGMPNSSMQIQLSNANTYNAFGKENIQILFSANAGMQMQNIDQSVSGGERSRVMLAIKKLLSEHQSLSTILFDEIDTGVSGKIASKMGEIMNSMGKFMQVISITHLPQVAALGQNHFKVEKNEKDGVTSTSVVKLNDEQRIEEIAQILSGNQISEAALVQAKQLMNLN